MASNYQLLTYILTPGTAALGPYLIPPSFPTSASTPLVVSVPNVRGSAAASVGCAIAASGDNTDFSLAWTGQGQLAQVTVQPTHVYSDLPADRAALYASFVAFGVQLEELELDTSTGCLAPGGADVIARMVAASLPLRLDEVLAYQCGLAVGSNYVDLAPGMRLRIEAGSYDFVAPASAWNSFGASGGATCTIIRSSAQDVGFDAFLASTATSVPLGSPAWVGGLADLVSLGPRRHFRLVVPRTMPGPGQTSAAPGFGQTPALIGADNWPDLATATAAYFATGSCVAATSGRPVICAAFTGRTVVVPEILVQFLGQWRYLPVGTTVQNLFDLCNPLFRALVPKGVVFNRSGLAGLAAPGGAYGPILVSPAPTTQYVAQPAGGLLSQWDLPLLPGDTLSSPWSGS